MSASYKHCSRCGEPKPVDQFNRQSSNKDGLKAWCRPCCSASKAEWDKRNRERTRSYSERYRIEHAEMLRQKTRQRYHAVIKHDPERYAAYLRRNDKWRHANPDVNKEYYKKHRKRLTDRSRERRHADPEKRHLRWNRASYLRALARDPERVRLQRRQRSAKRRQRVVAQTQEKVDYKAILERDKMICHLCNERIEAGNHEFDHVIPISKGGPHSMSNIKLAHKQCNRLKGAQMLVEDATGRGLLRKPGVPPQVDAVDSTRKA